MNDLGQVTITENSLVVDLGPVTLQPEEDALWVKVTQVSPVDPWPFSYGLLYWESSDGRTLGTVKAYGHTAGEIYRLSNGRAPSVRTGRLFWDSRHYNLQWVKADPAPTWTLSFQWTSGLSVDGGPSFGSRATAWVFADADDAGVPITVKDGFSYLTVS